VVVLMVLALHNHLFGIFPRFLLRQQIHRPATETLPNPATTAAAAIATTNREILNHCCTTCLAVHRQKQGG
jgi:hypothetical protein